MTKPWHTLASAPTKEGTLELRQRGDDFLIVIAGRVLMASANRRSEEALATLTCAALGDRSAPRILVGGLGMGFTLRAALETLPPAAQVIVAELNAVVVTWCRGPLAPLTEGAARDPRVRIEVADVAELIARADPGAYDAIMLDLYEGPHEAAQRPDDPFYGEAALARVKRALAPRGVFAVWSEDPDRGFARRLAAAGFTVTTRREARGRRHVVYLGVRREGRTR